MNQKRLEFCQNKMDVADTIISKGDGTEVEQLKEITNGQMADLVIDATGSNKSMSQALHYCAFEGRIVYVGITQQEVSFPHAPVMHRRELTLLASRNALPGDFERIIRLIEQKQIDTRPWITHSTNFKDLVDVFASFTRPETGVIKAVVTVA